MGMRRMAHEIRGPISTVLPRLSGNRGLRCMPTTPTLEATRLLLSRCGVREQRSRIQYWDITGSVTSPPRAQSHTSRGRAWKHSRQSFSSGRYRSEARRRSTRPRTWRESGRLHPSPPSTTGKTRWRCWSPHWPVAVRIKSPQILCFG